MAVVDQNLHDNDDDGCDDDGDNDCDDGEDDGDGDDDYDDDDDSDDDDNDNDHIPGGDGVDGGKLESKAAHVHQVLVRGCCLGWHYHYSLSS